MVSGTTSNSEGPVFVMQAKNNETPMILTQQIIREDEYYTRALQDGLISNQIKQHLQKTCISYLVEYNSQLNSKGVKLKAGSRLRRKTKFFFPGNLIQDQLIKLGVQLNDTLVSSTFSSLSLNATAIKRENDVPFPFPNPIPSPSIKVNEKCPSPVLIDLKNYMQMMLERQYDVLREVKLARDQVLLELRKIQMSEIATVTEHKLASESHSLDKFFNHDY